MGALYPQSAPIDPRTPFLQPQTLPDEENPVPDFYLNDDAGVGSCMDFGSDIPTASLSAILALERQYTSPSPTPSLVSDTSVVSDVSVSSQICKEAISEGNFKFKKIVRFHDSVEIVPLDADEPRSTGALKPPQEPMKIRKPLGSSFEAVREAENIGIMYGLGRAGGLRNSFAQLHKQELEKRVHSPPMADTSDSEDDLAFREFMLRARHHRRKQLHLQLLFPSPPWRNPADQVRTGEPLLKAPSTQQTSCIVAGGYNMEFEYMPRYALMQTSPPPQRALGPYSIPPPPTLSSSPSPLSSSSSPDGVRRSESNFRRSYSYNSSNSTTFSPPPLSSSPTAHKYREYSLPNFPHGQQQQQQPPQNRCVWRASDGVYRDQWGREVRIGGGKGTYTSFGKHDLWPVEELQEEVERAKLRNAAMRGLRSGGGGGAGPGSGSGTGPGSRLREREHDQVWRRHRSYGRGDLRAKR